MTSDFGSGKKNKDEKKIEFQNGRKKINQNFNLKFYIQKRYCFKFQQVSKIFPVKTSEYFIQ